MMHTRTRTTAYTVKSTTIERGLDIRLSFLSGVQFNCLAGGCRAVNSQDDFDRFSALAAIHNRGSTSFDRLHEIRELTDMAGVRDGGRVTRSPRCRRFLCEALLDCAIFRRLR